MRDPADPEYVATLMGRIAPVHPLEGLVSPEVGFALARHADAVGRVGPDQGLAIVEIGSYKGKSTCYLASGAWYGPHVYAIDPWDLVGNVSGRFRFAERSTRECFDTQVAELGFTDAVTAIQAFSIDAALAWTGEPIGLLFIDGDHSTAAVRADFEAWSPYLVDGATVIFDDYLSAKSSGVRPAVDALGLNDLHVEADWLAVGVVGR